MGNKKTGAICPKHPELLGLRYKVSGACCGCTKARNAAKSGHNYQMRAHKLKRAAMDRYGGVCAVCGESDLDVLTIDHIDGKGSQHRREMKGDAFRSAGGIGTYAWLKRNGYPHGFRVLCFNHNYKAFLENRRRARVRPDSIQDGSD